MIMKTMSPFERKATTILAFILSCRMLGLFMILPVLSLYAHQLQGATPSLIGFALGIYGFTQALLQIPFGAWSDRIGRKPVIFLGLALFGLGSIMAAFSTNIYWMIAARALQGGGAIGSTTLAFVSDITKEENRSKAMALVGITVGASFTVAIVLGPMLNVFIGVSGLFIVSAGFALLGIVVLLFAIPKGGHHCRHLDNIPLLKALPAILKNRDLQRLNFGIFMQHAILSAMFLALPLLMHQSGITTEHQWKLYLPALLLAFLFSLPLIIIAEVKRKIKPIMILSVAIIGMCQAGLAMYYHSMLMTGLFLWLFFTAFCVLEAILPSLTSKMAPIASKGTATGVYSTCQFLGIFVGAICAGFVYQHVGIMHVFGLCIIFSILWGLFALSLDRPMYLSSMVFSLPKPDTSEALLEDPLDGLLEKVQATTGVVETALSMQENAIYLKVDKDLLDLNRLQSLLHVK